MKVPKYEVQCVTKVNFETDKTKLLFVDNLKTDAVITVFSIRDIKYCSPFKSQFRYFLQASSTIMVWVHLLNRIELIEVVVATTEKCLNLQR